MLRLLMRGRGRSHRRGALRRLWGVVRAARVLEDLRQRNGMPELCCTIVQVQNIYRLLALAPSFAMRAGPFRFRSAGRRPLEPAATNKQVRG